MWAKCLYGYRTDNRAPIDSKKIVTKPIQLALIGVGEAFPTVEDCAYTIALTEAIQHGKQEWRNE